MTSLRRQRNVKIVATLGPASDTYEMIRSLFVAGARPFLTWVCGAGAAVLVLGYLAVPVLLAIAQGKSVPDPDGPVLDLLYWLTATLVGARSLETVTGRARTAIRPAARPARG